MTDNLIDTAIKQAAACAREKYAGEEKRIDKGLVIALNGQVTLCPDGTAQVRSDRDPEVFYTLRSTFCECPDWNNAPQGRCKHRWGAYFTRLAQAALAMEER